MRLVRGRAPGAQLLQREHQLDRVEHRDHARQPCGRQPAREPHELRARDVDVDEHPRDRRVVERGRLAPRPRDRGRTARRSGRARPSPPRGGRRARRRGPPRSRATAPGRSGRSSRRGRAPRAARSAPRGGARAARARRTGPTSRQPASRPRSRVHLRGLADERGGHRRVPAVELCRAPLRARPRSSGADGAPCRSRGSSRRAAARARLREAGCRRAGLVPPFGRRSAWRRSVSGVARSSAAATRSSCSASSSSGMPPGVRTRSGRFVPSG